MCGVFALIAPAGTDAAPLVAANDAVRHRGPDDEGYVLFRSATLDPVVCGGRDTAAQSATGALPYLPHPGSAPEGAMRAAFAHRRLSIVDLSAAGHQPMCTPDRRHWITYNGEIYNYLELRKELASMGHQFATATDTEVILAAYRQWGAACLARFNGMFAFVLLDRERGRIFCARDRFGVKPLYCYLPADGVLAFASEIKQFAALPGWAPRLQPQRAYDFLAWAALDHTAATMYRDVHQLRGGEALELDLDAIAALRRGARPATRRWYALAPRAPEGDFAQAAAQLRGLLEDSVRLRLRADVPVGSCLSGGIDSSAIVCVAHGLLRAQGAQTLQRTYSAVSESARFDERDYAAEAAASVGVGNLTVQPSLESLLADYAAVLHHHDEPFASASIHAQWSVFALARAHGSIVMLDGQGADEAFAGYPVFFRPRLAGLLRSLRLGSLAGEMTAIARMPGYGIGRALQLLLDGVLPESLRQFARRAGGASHARPDWLDLERLGAEAVPPDRALWGGRARTLGEESLRQLTASSLPQLLHSEDRNSMAHSVEARVPFLDYRVVEAALGLPEEFKLGAGLTKRVLREAMAGTVPARILARRDKMGFVTAEELWLRERAPQEFRRRLEAAIDATRGILRPAALCEFDAIVSGARPFSHLPWRMISFGDWMARAGIGAP